MKRRTIVILIMIFASLSLSAAPRETLQKKFLVQGGYYDFFSARITPLSAESQAYIHGMPFDLAGEDIRSSVTTAGRNIASWTLISNSKNFKLNVEAEPLRHVDRLNHKGEPAYEKSIYYELLFYYTISYVDNKGNLMLNHSFSVESGRPMSGEEMRAANAVFDKNVDPGTYVGSNNGSVYFKLTEQADNLIHKSAPEDAPAKGYYTGKVTLTMEVIN